MLGQNPLARLTNLLLGLGAVVFLLFLGALLLEAGQRYRLQRWRRVAARYEELVAGLVAGDCSPESLLRAVQRLDRPAVSNLLLEYAEYVDPGDEQERLLPAFRGLGAVGWASRLRRDWRWWVRAASARRLGQMRDPESLPVLQELLHDRNPEVRTVAAWALLQLPVPLPLAGLLEALVGRGAISHLRLAALFLAAGRRVVPDLVAFLSGSISPAAQEHALLLVGELHAIEAESGVLEALDSPHAPVREAACRALGKLESLGAYDGLVGALHDCEWSVRAAAAEALGRLGDPAAVPRLAALLDEPNPAALLAVCRALAGLGPSGLAVLRQRQGVGAQGLTMQVLAEVLAGGEQHVAP